MLRFWKHLDGAMVGALIGVFAGVVSPLAIGIANIYLSNQETARVAQITVPSVTELLDRGTGSPVGIEGRVDGPLRFQSLIAYQLQEADPSTTSNSPPWHTTDWVLPALQLDMSDGTIPVTGTYQLQGAQTTIAPDPERRYVGLARGQSVFAWGRIKQEDAGPVLIADTIYAGTRADYLGEQRFLQILGWSFVALSIALAVLFGWGIPQLLRIGQRSKPSVKRRKRQR